MATGGDDPAAVVPPAARAAPTGLTGDGLEITVDASERRVAHSRGGTPLAFPGLAAARTVSPNPSAIASAPFEVSTMSTVQPATAEGRRQRLIRKGRSVAACRGSGRDAALPLVDHGRFVIVGGSDVFLAAPRNRERP
jgi:hypothetical protein